MSDNLNYPICVNPSCKSYGKSHPHCNCTGQQRAEAASFASGGCVGDHDQNCMHYADGGQVQQNMELHNNPESAVEHAVANHGLTHLMTKTGHTRSEDVARPMDEFLGHVRKGQTKLASTTQDSFDKKHLEMKAPEIEQLRNTVDSVNQNPGQMMQVGGTLGSALPVHGAALAAKSATAMAYLQSIKPQGQQPGAFDKVIPPSKAEQYQYNRQLQIAEQPLTIVQAIKGGYVTPQDLITLHTIYPQLAESIKQKSFNAIVEAKNANKTIPYKQRMGIASLLGQPLDATMTQPAMAAIISSQMGQAQAAQKGKKNATAETQKTIEKTDALGATDSQNREIKERIK